MKKLSVGIGLTGGCNYNCAHCYSSRERGQSLPVYYLERLVHKNIISSVNFGTGESILYPHFEYVVKLFSDNKVTIGLTTNGTTVAAISDGQIRKFNDVDFSLDFPDEKAHDALRGAGAFSNVVNGIERCKANGVPCSLAMCMSKKNMGSITEMLSLADRLGVNLRVNIYKGIDPQFKLSGAEFWDGVLTLINNSYIISCSEPVVLPLLPYRSLRPSPDNALSIRIRPDGMVLPCVYWENPDLHLSEVIEYEPETLVRKIEDYYQASKRHLLPEDCLDCQYKESCLGGCSCRRQYSDINRLDEYCLLRNTQTQALDYKYIESGALVHSDYLCTIIVRGGRHES